MKSIFFILLMLTFNAHAGINLRAPKIVSKQLAKKIRLVQRALARQELDGNPLLYRGSDETAYYLKRIRMQYAAWVGFDISVFEVKVIPIIEFRWTRQNPNGWANYRRKI